MKVCKTFFFTHLNEIFGFRSCVIFTLVMMILAYIRDVSENEETVNIEHTITTRTEANGTVPSPFANDSPSNPPPDVVMHCPKTRAPKKMFFDEIVECFSVRKNMQILTSVHKPANAVPIVDGLKYVLHFICLQI